MPDHFQMALPLVNPARAGNVSVSTETFRLTAQSLRLARSMTLHFSHGPQSQMGAEPVLDVNGIARWQRARRVLGLDLDDKEPRAGSSRMQGAGNLLDALHVTHHTGFAEPAGLRHRREIKTVPGMTHLHAGLAEVVVVDHHDDEVLRIGHRDGGEPTEPHQLLTVARDHHDRAVRLRLRETQADQCGRAHGAPEIVVAVMITSRVHVVGRRAKAGDDKKAVAPGEQAGHDLAAIERALSRCHVLTTSWRRAGAAREALRPAARRRTRASQPTRRFRSDLAGSRPA